MTQKTGKYIVWEYAFYFTYSGESQQWNRNFEVRIRVGTMDLYPQGKERLMYYIAQNLMDHIDIDISGPEWSTRSIGVRQVGRSDSDAMKYKIIDKNLMHPFVFPKKHWGYVSDSVSMEARRLMRKAGYGRD